MNRKVSSSLERRKINGKKLCFDMMEDEPTFDNELKSGVRKFED